MVVQAMKQQVSCHFSEVVKSTGSPLNVGTLLQRGTRQATGGKPVCPRVIAIFSGSAKYDGSGSVVGASATYHVWLHDIISCIS
jgi:hypothetical protein